MEEKEASRMMPRFLAWVTGKCSTFRKITLQKGGGNRFKDFGQARFMSGRHENTPVQRRS